jgi:hypothetical protein
VAGLCRMHSSQLNAGVVDCTAIPLQDLLDRVTDIYPDHSRSCPVGGNSLSPGILHPLPMVDHRSGLAREHVALDARMNHGLGAGKGA